MSEEVERVKVGGLRTLGAERNDDVEARAGSRSALETLRAEFQRVLDIKHKMSAEAAVGGKEKSRAPENQDEKLRALVASLEGMSRFALKMNLITPAESRELYADAMKRGLYDGWKK